MVALSVSAILLSVAAPSMGEFVRNSRLQAQSFAMLRTINFARTEAIKRKTRVILCRSANPTATPPSCGGTSYEWSTGFLVFASGDANNTYEDGVDDLLRIGVPLSDGLSMRTNSTSNRNLEYNWDGTTNESDGTAHFAICDQRGSDYGRQIEVSPVGRPRLFKSSTSEPVNCTSPS